MPWVLNGTSPPANLTRDVEDIVLDYLRDNWTETVPGVNDIIWTDDWYDQNGDFCIAVNDTQRLPGKKSVGFGSTREYKEYVDVHMFVRMLEQTQNFAHLGNMEREIDRILNTVRIDTEQQGFAIVDFTEAKQDPEPDGVQTSIWHSHITLEIRYYKTLIP